jgi:hypothetical protein
MCSDPHTRRARRGSPAALALALALAGAAALGLAGCGKKGDPEPPLRSVPQTTDRLTVMQRHLDLVLELPYPKTTAAGLALPGLDRLEVWEARRPAAGTLPLAEGEPAAEGGEEGEVEAEAAEGASAESEAPAGGEAVQTAEAELATGTAAPPPLDPRQFEAAATLRASLSGAMLSDAVVGERIVVRLPLPAELGAPETYYLAVRTVAGGEDRSEVSNQAVIVPRPPPPAPRGLAAEAGPGGVRLSWQGDGPATTGYDVYRRGAQERLFLDPIARLDAGATTYFDEGARFGESYIYAVTAVAARTPTIESAVASTVEVDYRDRFAPAPPAGLVALVEEGRVRLAWEAAEAADLAGYRVSRAVAGGAFQPVGPALVTASEWVDEQVLAGTAYTWRVVSVDAEGNGSEPAEVTAEAR